MDANTKELTDKVHELVKTKYGGDYFAAFKAYDLDGSGKLGRKDLRALLEDAGIGNTATRGLWADGILDKLDANKDGAVSIPELMLELAKSVAFPPAA